jgi:hypothetical protein
MTAPENEHGWFTRLGLWLARARLPLSIATALFISSTAYLCAWDNYRWWDAYATATPLHSDPEDEDVYLRRELDSFWKFATMRGAFVIQLTCVLAGLFAFPLLLLCSRPTLGPRPDLIKTLVGWSVTAGFAIGTAWAISLLHLPFDHH